MNYNEMNLTDAISNERAYILTMGVKYQGWIHQVEVLAKRRLTDHEVLKLWEWLVLVGIETEDKESSNG